MDINRVKTALQRTTHLSDKQLWKQYPEFMKVWWEAVQEERRSLLIEEVTERKRQILCN